MQPKISMPHSQMFSNNPYLRPLGGVDRGFTFTEDETQRHVLTPLSTFREH